MDSKTFLKTVGQKIRAIRKSKGLSQEKLAELSGIHFTHVSDIENGKVNLSASSLFSIATALDVPYSEIVNMPSGKADNKIEANLAVLLSQFRGLSVKKQGIFLSAAKGLITGIKET